MKLKVLNPVSGEYEEVASLVSSAEADASQVRFSDGSTLVSKISVLQTADDNSMKTADYTGSGLKKVNKAVSAENADSAAKSDNGIFEAVHSKNGTVHTLTAEGNAVFVVFQATAGYTAGDAVKIGSATLEAVDMRNTALSDKAFLSGDTVYLWKVGNKAVFFCAGRQVFSSEPATPREGDLWVL